MSIDVIYIIYGSAYLKGVPIQCFPIVDIQKELHVNNHDTLATLITNSKLKVPILGVHRDTGSTSWHDDNLKEHQRFAFGIPRWFLRFDFTSAIEDVPFAYLSWIKFTIESATKNCFMGHISADEWNSGPYIHKSDNINPFCSIDDIMPSRFDVIMITFDYNLMLFDANFTTYLYIILFVTIYRFALAYDSYNAINIDIGFLSLDPDRVNEDLTGGKFTDLGENVDLSSNSNVLSDNMSDFLNAKI